MADTIGGGINEDGSLQNTLVIDEKYAESIDIVGLENAGVTELAINSPVKDVEIGLKGDVDTAVAGARLAFAEIVNEAPAGETASVTIAVTKAKKLDFTTTGEGATDLSVPEGRMMKPTITTAEGDAEDSISFGIASTVKSADISTGGGNDTIVFDGRMKGRSIISTGDGADVIEVNRRSGKGKLRITDFSSDDTLIVDGVTITTDNLEDAPKWIKFGGDPR